MDSISSAHDNGYKLAAFDFDYTVINANSNNMLNKLVMEREQDKFKSVKQTPSIAQLNHFQFNSEIEQLGIDHRDDNTIRVNAIYSYMQNKHQITREDMEKCLKAVEIGEHMRNLISYLKKAGYDIIIVSDSNTFLIETILKHNDLWHFFSNEGKILANRGYFDSHGCLRVKPANLIYNKSGEKFSCISSPFCKKNICKGDLIEGYLKKQGRPITVEKLFVGDGRIDLCAGMRLSARDVFFVRHGMVLFKLLQSEAGCAEKIRAHVSFWKSGEDILSYLKSR